MLVWLLKNRVQLGRLTILLSLFPIWLSNVPLLTLPMLLAGITLFLTSNYRRIKNSFIKFYHAHFWLKIQYFWFTISIFVVGWMIYENVNDVIVLPYLVSLLYLIIYVIWFNRINTKITTEGRRIILKGETNEKSSTLDIEPYLIPLLLTLMVVFFISSILALRDSRGDTIFMVEHMYWYFPLAILILHFVVDILMVEQIDWYPKEGFISWKTVDLPTDLPDVNNPNKLASYFFNLSRINAPPENLHQFIEDNLELLVKTAQDLSYFPFHIEYVRCVENWGREGRDHIHLLMTIILASVSQYRFIGLIPTYKRKMFYQGLQTIAMTGSMTQRWRDLVEFEVDSKKDEHYVLDWVLGSRYLQFKYNPDWIVSWEGLIYKGKVGYYEAVRKMDMLIQIRPEMNQWKIDIWDLCYEYSKVFIGEDSRKILSKNLQFYDQLLYLSAKRTTEEYFEEKRKYKQELLNPSNRLVIVADDLQKTQLKDNEKRDIINAYLSSEKQTYEGITWRETIKLSIQNNIANLRNVQFLTFIKLLLLIGFFFANLGFLLFLDNVFEQQIGLMMVVIEVVILFIFSISPSDSDVRLDDQQTTQKQVLATSTFSQSAINVTTANFSTATAYLIYGIVLLFSYRFIAF